MILASYQPDMFPPEATPGLLVAAAVLWAAVIVGRRGDRR